MKNKLQIVWSSIAIISVCACSTPYTQPDAPIKEVPFMYMENVNLWNKGKSFLEAKFLGKKYGKSF